LHDELGRDIWRRSGVVRAHVAAGAACDSRGGVGRRLRCCLQFPWCRAFLAAEAAAVHGLDLGGGRLLHHLDGVPVGVQDKGQALHAPAVGGLLEAHAEVLEPRAGRVHVRHRDPDVPEPAVSAVGVVARVVGGAFLGLGAVVVRELDEARQLRSEHVARPQRREVRHRDALGQIAHEVQAELVLRHLRTRPGARMTHANTMSTKSKGCARKARNKAKCE